MGYNDCGKEFFMGKCKSCCSHKKGNKKKCKCKGKCKCCKYIFVLPVLAIITFVQLIAPKKYKKSLPGKCVKYTLLITWIGILLHSILAIVITCKKGKKRKK